MGSSPRASKGWASSPMTMPLGLVLLGQGMGVGGMTFLPLRYQYGGRDEFYNAQDTWVSSTMTPDANTGQGH